MAELTKEQLQILVKTIEEALKQIKDGLISNPDNETPLSKDDFILKAVHVTSPDKWTVVSMKDFPELFKVVDGKGKNVATNFKTKAKAQKFIDVVVASGKWPTFPDGPPPTHDCPEGQIWSNIEQKCVPKSPEPEPCPEGKVRDPVTGQCVDKPVDPDPQPGGDTDKFGVRSIYPATGFREYKYILKPNAGLRHNFDAIKSPTPNTEITGYFSIDKAPDDEVSGKWSVTTHSDGNHVKCLDIGVDNNTGDARYRYEDPHPVYTNTIATGSKNGVALGPKFVGYKFIRLTLPDGTVQLEVWQDQGDNEGSTPANQWVQLAKWKVDEKYAVRDYPGGVYAVLRLDGDGIEENLKQKWLSYVEVKPPST